MTMKTTASVLALRGTLLVAFWLGGCLRVSDCFQATCTSSSTARAAQPRGQAHERRQLSLVVTPLASSTATAADTTGAAVVHDEDTTEDELALQKRRLLGLLRKESVGREDPVLADPVTKEGITISTTRTRSSALLGTTAAGSTTRRNRRRIRYRLKSSTNEYAGSSDSFLNLLNPIEQEEATGEISEQQSSADDTNNKDGGARFLTTSVVRNAVVPLIPPPLRSALATAGLPVGEDYVPMRDLFTSPAVSFAYERGWRQNFRGAGFPGADKEAQLAMEYVEPAMELVTEDEGDERVLVDMSCATGLFTRRFAKSGKYDRVLGCDYSASMLSEARRRIRRDAQLGGAGGGWRTRRARKSNENKNNNKKDASTTTTTRLDLVRCDVGRIPMRDGSVNALHAGAAMHCWPDLPAAVGEIYRVLKPAGGRYFATTFLSTYFGVLQSAEGGATGPSRQAFQYFESVEQIRDLMESAGFERSKIDVQVLPPSCVIIRSEK